MARQAAKRAASKKATAKRRPRPRLSREKIIDEAFRLADEEGVANLSMRKLAARLGVDPMSLYNHVENRDAILDGIVEQLVARLELPEEPADWESWVRDFAQGAVALAVEHPRAFLAMKDRTVSTPAGVRPFEPGLAAFRRAGFDAATTAKVFTVVVNQFVGAFALAVADELVQEQQGRVEQAVPHLDDFPYVEEFVEQLAEVQGEGSLDTFTFGIEIIIAGLRAQLPAKRRKPGASSVKTTRRR